VGDDITVDSETLFVTDFVNFKIKPTQYFKYTHKNKMYIHMFHMNIYTYMISTTVFLKKRKKEQKVEDDQYKPICLN
jgi:hypothetical protein